MGKRCCSLHPRHNRRLLSTLERETTPAPRMGKMKKGKAHHWYKEEKTRCQRSPMCPQGSRAGVQRRHQGRQKRSMCPPEPRGEGSQARRIRNKISIDEKDGCCCCPTINNQ